jgi:eukaryotic-like serine/threonine-protein kinase
VAIKMLKHNMAIDSAVIDRFQNEARLIAGLNHENIVRVYDIESIYRTVFIVMEYLDGFTLRHILENRLRLQFDRLLNILIQVCGGLDYAHGHGIVHQDVKPGNIFVQRGDRVRIVDFGLACPIGGCSDDFQGTAFYMAPEQIEGEAVDQRTDIYSLGIMAYEMATGRRPFPDDVCEVFKAHITQPTPDPRAMNPALPKEFSEFISRATSKDPAARFQSLRDVREELRRMAGIEVAAAAGPRRKRKMMSLFMFYEDEHQLELNRLLARFSEKLKKIGAELRAADFDDI